MNNEEFLNQKVKNMSVEELQKAITIKKRNSCIDITDINIILGLLQSAFEWSKTPQRYNYWAEVKRNLIKLKDLK